MSLMGRTNLTSLLRRTQASPGRFQGLGLLLGVLMLSLGPPARAHADEGLPRAMALLEYLPVGSRCRGFLPCEKSGDYGIHVRLLGALTLDEQRRVRQGLLAPSVQLSVMEAGECGVAFPLRFYELGQTVPERMRVFCQASLPRGLLPSSGGAVFANANLATGPFAESGAPSGPRATTVDVGGVVGGDLGSFIHAGVTGWATAGEGRPILHAGVELAVRTEIVILFAQLQFHDRLECIGSSAQCGWGLLGTLGLSFPSEALPTSAHVSLGRGAAVPFMTLAVQGGFTYDVRVRERHGDGHEAAERFWDRALGPLRYRLRLRRRGYWDPYPDEQGLLRDEVDHSVLGLLGVPDPSRPGYILTPFGISIPVGASLEIRGDRPFVASPAFPGRVLTYIPLLALTPHGGALPRPVLDEIYFARLEDERRREELAVQDELRQMDSPWAKAALNAAVDFLTEPMRLFLAAASPDSPGLRTLKRQAQLLHYRDGYEEYKGEIAESLLLTYGSLLTGWALAPLRFMATTTARELAAGLSGLRAEAALGTASRAPRLLTRVLPRLNPGNYRLEVRGLGSNFGNVRLGYEGAEVGQLAEAAEHARPVSGAEAEALTLERTVPSRAPDPNAVPRGRPELPSARDREERIEALRLQDETAHILAQAGYDVLRSPPGKANRARPDYIVEGKYFDCYSPSNPKPRNIWREVKSKVTDDQADRIVVNLDNSSVDISALREQFKTWPIKGLREIIFLKHGNILPF
jgi:hypothetical protein